MLSLTSEYGLRAMTHLAKHQADWPVPGKQIAEEAGIPPKYPSMVLADLVRVGLLEATRGRSAARAPERSSGRDPWRCQRRRVANTSDIKPFSGVLLRVGGKAPLLARMSFATGCWRTTGSVRRSGRRPGT